MLYILFSNKNYQLHISNKLGLVHLEFMTWVNVMFRIRPIAWLLITAIKSQETEPELQPRLGLEVMLWLVLGLESGLEGDLSLG